MPYPFLSFLTVLIFALIHFFAFKIRKLRFGTHSKFLSAGGGIAISYVFIDLLPKISESDLIITQALSGVIPYFERHAYIMALLGFLLFFTVDRAQKAVPGKKAFWLSLFSYALFNFLIGYAVADKDNPEVKPLLLFGIAMGLHYFTNDYTLSEVYEDDYEHFGKWLLVSFLFLGWLLGLWITLSPTAVALISAFIGGGVIMNVIRHELPQDKPNNLRTFLFAAFLYTIILLTIGN